jgi:hypothetical protein
MQDSENQMLSARANESRLKQELCISEQRVQALEGEHSRIKELVEQQFSRQIMDLEQKIEQAKAERETELEQVHARYLKFTILSKIVTKLITCRLKGVLEKKESIISQLKAQEAELSKRCKHLESLLGR